MRTVDVLIDGFENIKILQQYLYLSEDNSITVKNSLGVELEISMNDEGHYYAKNATLLDVPAMLYDSDMSVPVMLGIIEYLQSVPAIKYPNKFENRWEEIVNTCLHNVAFNEKIRMES